MSVLLRDAILLKKVELSPKIEGDCGDEVSEAKVQWGAVSGEDSLEGKVTHSDTC